MTSIGTTRLIQIERAGLLSAALGVIAAAALVWVSSRGFGLAYRLAVFAWLAPALGSMMFALVHRMTGGEWAEELRPFFDAGITLLPWIWLAAAVALLFPPFATEPWPDYASHAMIAVRSGVFAVIFFSLSGAMRRSDAAWIGPAGLIALVFALHVLADDWIAALGPHWHSTAFPLVWMLGQAVAGLSAALLGAIWSGADPRADEGALGLDWGNLLLATLLLWCYVMFAQFLIVWSGNLPREIAWFEQRASGGWIGVAVILAAFHFAVPFVLLLSRRIKQRRSGIASVAGLLLIAQWVVQAWLILPAAEPVTLSTIGLTVALIAAVGGVFINRYLALARREENLA